MCSHRLELEEYTGRRPSCATWAAAPYCGTVPGISLLLVGLVLGLGAIARPFLFNPASSISSYNIGTAQSGSTYVTIRSGRLSEGRDKLDRSIQERDPCGVQMQIGQPRYEGGYCCLRDRPPRQRNPPGDHGTVPVRRTYAPLETKGPLEDSHHQELTH